MNVAAMTDAELQTAIFKWLNAYPVTGTTTCDEVLSAMTRTFGLAYGRAAIYLRRWFDSIGEHDDA